MTDVQVYIILSIIVTGFLGIIWGTKLWRDCFIKFALIGVTIMGIALYLKHYYL